MFDIVPFRRAGQDRRNDLFPALVRSFFDDNFLPTFDLIQSNFRVDLKETDNEFIVEADLPGIKKEAIEVEFNNNYLQISAKREDTVEDKSQNYVRRERHYGELKRVFHIDNVDENGINASFNDGVLRVTLPKMTKGMTGRRKIDIN
jgi:HSP20 family protein